MKNIFKLFLFCVVFSSCKINGLSCFKNSGFKRSDKTISMSNNTARLRLVEPYKKYSNACKGLYIFEYAYGEYSLLVPVLNFGSTYFIYNGNDTSQSRAKLQEFKRSSLLSLSMTELREIEDRYIKGTIFVGHN